MNLKVLREGMAVSMKNSKRFLRPFIMVSTLFLSAGIIIGLAGNSNAWYLLHGASDTAQEIQMVEDFEIRRATEYNGNEDEEKETADKEEADENNNEIDEADKADKIDKDKEADGNELEETYNEPPYNIDEEDVYSEENQSDED